MNATNGFAAAARPAGTGTPAMLALSAKAVVMTFTRSMPCQNTSAGLKTLIPLAFFPS